MPKESLKTPKAVIRSRKSKYRQHNDQKEKWQKDNNNLQNTTHKTKDRATRTTLKHLWWKQVVRKGEQILLH